VIIGVVALGAASRYAIKAATFEDSHFVLWHGVALGLWAVLAVAVVTGWRGRVAAAAMSLLGAYMITAGIEFFNNNHMYLTTSCLALVAFSDCERHFAIRPAAAIPDAWPRRLMQIQLTIVYLFAGLQKINGEFLSGDALNHFMAQTVGPLAPLAHTLQGTALVTPMAYVVVLTEASLSLMVWSKRLRTVAFAVVLPLHTGMLLVAYNWLELYGIVLFATLTFVLLSAFVEVEERSRLVVWDDSCSFCKRWVSAFQKLDAWHALRFTGAGAPASYAGTGITPDAAAHAIQVLAPDGRVHAGFDAVKEIVAVLPGGFLVAPWMALPPIARAGEAAYRRVAARRTCAIEPTFSKAA
jgi:predicted DCC family thiol-disulfide oxidoreductase YuxK